MLDELQVYLVKPLWQLKDEIRIDGYTLSPYGLQVEYTHYCSKHTILANQEQAAHLLCKCGILRSYNMIDDEVIVAQKITFLFIRSISFETFAKNHTLTYRDALDIAARSEHEKALALYEIEKRVQRERSKLYHSAPIFKN